MKYIYIYIFGVIDDFIYLFITNTRFDFKFAGIQIIPLKIILSMKTK